MTKARARERAKAKSADKVAKRAASADRAGPERRPGQFNPGTGSISSPRATGTTKSFGGAKRGASRSR